MAPEAYARAFSDPQTAADKAASQTEQVSP